MKKQWLVLLCVVLCVFAFSGGISAGTLLDTGVSADSSADKVHVIVENTTFTPEVAEAESITWEDSFWSGTLVDTWVELNENSTMMSCVVAAVATIDGTVEGADSGYISGIHGLDAFDGGGGSGWMGTLNDWFTNEGFDAYTVAKGTLAANDEIRIVYTRDYGPDVGGVWGDTDTSLKGLTFGAGTLSPAFDKETKDYVLTVPVMTDSVLVTPTASNKNYQVRTYIGEKEYKRTVKVPVTEGTEITVKCGDPEWPSMNEDAEPTVYTVKVVKMNADLSAVWPSFRGNENNNGITSAQTPRTASESELLWTNTLSSGWSNVPSPVILVDDSVVTMSGKSLKKLDPATGEIIASGDMSAAPSWSTVPPTYGDGMIFCPLGGGKVEAFNGETLESMWVFTDEKGGQAQNPITYADGKVYVGFGYNKEYAFVCLSADTGEVIWRQTDAKGFYWAGAVVAGQYVLCGNESGHLYCWDKDNGEVIEDVVVEEGSPIRSSICYDNGKIYFSQYKGYLCVADLNAETGKITNLEKIDCTEHIKDSAVCTPVVYDGMAYMGVGDYVLGIDLDEKEVKWSVSGADNSKSSPLLSNAYEADGEIYLYVTYNTNPGGLYVIKAKTDGSEAAQELLYDAAGFEQYCMCSAVADENGTVYYKNDSGTVFAIGMKEEVKQQLKDEKAAKAVEDKIESIGNVTLASKGAIDDARTAYDALTESQKKLVTNYDKLAAAEEAYAVITAVLPFTDVADDAWYTENVRYVWVNNIMNGVSATTFAPESTLTRGMYVTMLYRLSGEPETAGDIAYDDVEDDEWYTKAVIWGTEKGIVEGYAGKFSPNASITREQMAAMMYRYAKWQGVDVSAQASFDSFKDGTSVSDWAKEEMGWAVASKLMQGHDTGNLEPQGNATRAQASAVMQRFAENMAK